MKSQLPAFAILFGVLVVLLGMKFVYANYSDYLYSLLPEGGGKAWSDQRSP